MNKATGTIFLPTASALALWKHEVTGQISDGTWENASPREHYQFWCRLERAKGTPAVQQTSGHCKRWYYGLNTLVSMKWSEGEGGGYILRGRMLNMGRLAMAHEALGGRFEDFGYEQRYAAEDMPATLEEFTSMTDERFRKAVPDELARQYYATDYTLVDLRKDIRAIAAAMKTMDPNR